MVAGFVAYGVYEKRQGAQNPEKPGPRGATPLVVAGMALMAFYGFHLAGLQPEDNATLAIALIGHAGAALEGFGAAAALLAVMGFLKDLQPHAASVVPVFGFAAAAIVLLCAGCIGSPWFVIVHALLVGGARLCWDSATGHTPDGLRLSQPTSEVWGSFVPAHNWIATAEFSGLSLYGLLLASACSIRCATYDGVFLLKMPASVLIGGVIIYAGAILTLVLFYTSKRLASVTRAEHIVLPIFGAAAVCAATIPQLSFIAECLVLSALLFWSQVFLLMALPIMRSKAANLTQAVGIPNAGQALAAALAIAFARPLLQQVNMPSALLVATATIMVLLNRCVQQNEPFFSTYSKALPKFVENLPSDQASRLAPAIVRYGLTAREADVLPLLLSGVPAASIAAELCVSVPTVNSHVQHIYAKVGVHGREELAAKLGAD